LDLLELSGGTSGVTEPILFNFALNQSLVTMWNELYVYTFLILSVLLLAAFFCVELRVARYLILPVAVFTSDIDYVFECTAAD
jgi:hypothetical protein